MKKLYYLDTVKGLACVIVFFSHYLTAFNNFQFSFFNYRFINFLRNGNFAVCVFFTISSFLLSDKMLNINSNHSYSNELGKICIKRYLRLTIPIFFASAFVLFLQYTVGFHNVHLGQLTNNSWLMGFYSSKLGLRDFFEASAYKVLWCGDNTFNGPFWMLKDMFFGTYLTIIICLISYNFKKPLTKYIFLILLLLMFYNQNSYFFAICLGILWSYLSHEKFYLKDTKPTIYHQLFLWFAVILLCVSIGYYNRIIDVLRNRFNIQGYITTNQFWNSLIAFFILLSLGLIFRKKDLKSTNYLTKFGKYNMGVYLFHWPVLCSVSTKLYIKYFMENNHASTFGYFLHLFATLIAVIVISIIYTSIIEKNLSKWLDRVINKMYV